jgi:putative inorganic carbon (HCO3(-)) transporter
MVAGAISLSPAMQERLQRVTETKTTTFEYYDRILSGRLTIWDTVGHMVIDRPWTGVGAGMFAATYDRYSTRTDDPYRTGGSFGSPFHAHNIYLSIAAETGLLGLLGIIAAFILCVKWYYAASPSRREQAWPYAFGLLIALFPTSIEYTLYKHWFFPVPLLLLCATLAALGDETVTVPTPVRKWQG